MALVECSNEFKKLTGTVSYGNGEVVNHEPFGRTKPDAFRSSIGARPQMQ